MSQNQKPKTQGTFPVEVPEFKLVFISKTITVPVRVEVEGGECIVESEGLSDLIFASKLNEFAIKSRICDALHPQYRASPDTCNSCTREEFALAALSRYLGYRPSATLIEDFSKALLFMSCRTIALICRWKSGKTRNPFDFSRPINTGHIKAHVTFHKKVRSGVTQYYWYCDGLVVTEQRSTTSSYVLKAKPSPVESTAVAPDDSAMETDSKGDARPTVGDTNELPYSTKRIERTPTPSQVSPTTPPIS